MKLHTDMSNLNNVYIIESLNKKGISKIKKIMANVYLLIFKRFIFLVLLQGLIFNNFDFFDIYDPYICLVLLLHSQLKLTKLLL